MKSSQKKFASSKLKKPAKGIVGVSPFSRRQRPPYSFPAGVALSSGQYNRSNGSSQLPVATVQS